MSCNRFQYALHFSIGLFAISGCAASRLQNTEVYIRQQNWQDARMALEEVTQLNPKDGEAHLLLAEVYGELDRIPQMNATLGRIRSLSPKYEGAANYLASKYWIRNYKLGNLRFEERIYSEAVIHFHLAVQIDSTNDTGWQRLGDALFMRGSYGNAQKAYTAALKLDPRSLAMKHNLAQIYFLQKKYRDAVRLCDEILARDESDFDALLRRAYSSEALGAFDEAKTDYLAAVTQMPSAQLLTDFALLHFKNEDYETAITLFEEALEFSPNNPLLYKYLGEANWRIRDYQAMAGWYRKIVEVRPDALTGWKNLAVAYEALDQKEHLAQARHYINRINSTN